MRGSFLQLGNTNVLRWASNSKALTIDPLNAAFLDIAQDHCAKAWLAAVAPHFSSSRSVLKSALVIFVLGEESSTIPLVLATGFLMYHFPVNSGSTP